MKIYTVTVKLFNEHGYVPTKAETPTVRASNPAAAARIAIKCALAEAPRRKITAVNVQVKFSANVPTIAGDVVDPDDQEVDNENDNVDKA